MDLEQAAAVERQILADRPGAHTQIVIDSLDADSNPDCYGVRVEIGDRQRYIVDPEEWLLFRKELEERDDTSARH